MPTSLKTPAPAASQPPVGPPAPPHQLPYVLGHLAVPLLIQPPAAAAEAVVRTHGWNDLPLTRLEQRAFALATARPRG